ncbi:MAG: class I SAM-dependent methyltransferase [Thiohalocapsa sp. PB-PSB1]|nr:MAG: class I SAM-dependent methyltransferase [Thiohalocapsa sp. PB-PSB1]
MFLDAFALHELAVKLKSPVLDLGCGAAPYIRVLRDNSIEAYGLEIDRYAIREHLADDVRKFVTLYDGSLPLPFDRDQFESILCTEVLEHVEDYQALLSEISRIARSLALITVPDMTCIVNGSYQGVVPWHLLESSHINFFTASNLEPLIKKYFRNVTPFQLAHSYVNGQFMAGSLGYLAEK